MFFTWGMLKSKQISKVLIVLLAVLFLGLGILNTFAPTIDISEYQQDILAELSQAMQRKFSIDGKVSLKLSLKPTLVTQNFQIDNPEWCKTPHFLKSEQVEIGVDILDLLFGKTTIDRLILGQAEINFETNKTGENNWSFGKQKAAEEQDKTKSAVRLDYVVLDAVRLNYLSPKQNKKFNIAHGSLRRNLRGRYRIVLDSKLGEQKLLVKLRSNRWFDYRDFRPLKLKIETEFGENNLIANMNIQELTPALKLDMKLNSDMIDVDSIQKQFPKKDKKQVKNTDTLDDVEAWLKKIDILTLEMNVGKIRYGQYEISDLFVKNRLIHDKAWNKDIYSIETTGLTDKVVNKKDKRHTLLGATGGSEYGRVDFFMHSKGESPAHLISNANIKLKIRNLSGNRPYPYIIKTLKMDVGQERRVNFTGKANYRDTRIDFIGKTGKDFLKTFHQEKKATVDVNLAAGKSKADVSISVRNLHKQTKKLQMHVDGTHLQEWSLVLGKKLPLIGKYVLDSQLDLRKDGIKSRGFTFKTPASHLKGKFFYHYGKPATLNMQLHKSHLAIVDVRREPEISVPAPVEKTAVNEDVEDKKPEQPVMVIPRTDLMSLLSPTTKVNFKVKSSSVAFKRFTVTGLELNFRWEDKVFATQIMKGKVAKGDLTSDIYLTVVDNEAAGKIEMHIKQLDYGKLMQEMKIGDKMKGIADVNIHLVGFGRDLKEFLSDSDGIAEFVGEKGVLASKYIKLWGEDIVQQILPFNWFGSEQTGLNCVVGRFDLTDGRLSSDSILIDTEGMTIAGTGAINLNTEELAFELMPDPKNVSLISLATPVKIRGTLAKPRIEPHTLGTTWTIGSLLAGLANPAILIARFAKLGSLGENPCLAAIGKKEGEKEETSILKMFKDTVKFIQRPLDKMPDLE